MGLVENSVCCNKHGVCRVGVDCIGVGVGIGSGSIDVVVDGFTIVNAECDINTIRARLHLI